MGEKGDVSSDGGEGVGRSIPLRFGGGEGWKLPLRTGFPGFPTAVGVVYWSSSTGRTAASTAHRRYKCDSTRVRGEGEAAVSRTEIQAYGFDGFPIPPR